jgi:hypothetical protein
MTAASEPLVDLDSPKQLRGTFQPKLANWGMDAPRLKLLEAVLANWLRAEGGDDIPHFRQRHRRHRGHMAALDDLVSRQLVTHGGAGKYYEPKFLGFCLLLANGSRTAVRLRSVMDQILRLVGRYLAEHPLRLQRSTTEIRKELPEELQDMLLPAIRLLSETSVGISLGGNTLYPDLAFSDAIDRYSSPTQLAWTFLQDYRGTSGYPYVGFEPVSIPFNLTRLLIAPEVHASASKAVSSVASNPDSAVSHARAALEATFKQILWPGHPQLKAKLPEQASVIKDLLQLKGEFWDLGSHLLEAMKAIGNIRNKLGDSHGRGPGEKGATRPEAQLTVGAALLLCEFFLDRWEAVRSLPSPTLVSSNKKAA